MKSSLKHIILGILVFFTQQRVKAQDTLYYSNSTFSVVEIEDINSEYIQYHDFWNKLDPSKKASKDLVQKIVFSSGRVVNIGANKEKLDTAFINKLDKKHFIIL